MPDSLTKFKKDAPKKTSAPVTTPTTPPVVDGDGNTVPFVAPTKFYFVNEATPTAYESVDASVTRAPVIDGTLSDTSVSDLFFERCDLVTTGNSQTQALPSGLVLNVSTCQITGKPLSIKTVSTPFCSDGTSGSQAACEAVPFTWTASTGTCSNPDYQYQTSAACLAGRHKWYKVGSPIPYRITLKYHNATGTQSTISTTFNIGIYKTPVDLRYTQSDKVVLKVGSGNGYSLTDIAAVTTTTSSAGAYARENVISGAVGAAGIAKIVDAPLNKIGVNKFVPLYVSDTTPFTVGGFVAVVGTCSNPAYTTRAACLAGAAVWTGTGIIGKVAAIDSLYDQIYVENISTGNKYFRKNDKLSSDFNGYTTAATVTDIDNQTSFIEETGLDNDSQYYTARFKVTEPINVYETGASYTIKPLEPFSTSGDSISADNGVTYKISPALPPTLSFDTSTGIISGYFAVDFTATQYTITATNPLGKTSFAFKISSITSPADYTLTNRQIITVNSTAFFKEGETLYQPIVPPMAEALHAKIVKIVNAYQLAIETFNGAIIPGASLDNNSSTYKAEKAYVIPYSSCVVPTYATKTLCEGAGYVWAPSAAVHYNLAVTLSSVAGYTAGSYLNSITGTGAGAKGLVKFVDSTAKTLYVQYLTQAATSVAAAKSFYQADVVDTGATIDQIIAGAFKVDVAVPASFTVGSDVVTSGSAAGYTYNKSGNTLYIGEVSKKAAGTWFNTAHTIYNDEVSAGATPSAISSVSHDNYIIFERGKNMNFQGNLNLGSNGIIYSISPSLPAGLTLDTSTGVISGTATASTPKKDFLLTASNFIGSTTFAVGIEVKDYFEVVETSGAASFMLHKVGDNQINRKCRVDSADIATGTNGKALDVRCFLEGEEQDLHQSEIKFSFKAGPGICEYIQYDPYYFYKFSPAKSFEISTKYQSMSVIRTGCTGVINTGEIPTANECEANYASIDSTFPNCDEGRLAYWTETYTEPAAGSCVFAGRTKNYVNCGGKRQNCISGPATDMFNNTQLIAGKRATISPAIAGASINQTHTAPINHGDSFITVRNANNVVNNQCYATNTDVDAWSTAVASQNILASPLAVDSNPFYTVTCRDAAYDIKARIRIVVRDWDKTFRIDSGVDNMNYNNGTTVIPPVNMNNSTNDMFGNPYNDYYDWDDNYSTGASTFTLNSCGVQTAALGNCTATSFFKSDTQCTTVGGDLVTPGSCSAGGFTTKVTCEDAGNTWTNPTCRFNNQYQCELYGGTWNGSEQIKFPADWMGTN